MEAAESVEAVNADGRGWMRMARFVYFLASVSRASFYVTAVSAWCIHCSAIGSIAALFGGIVEQMNQIKKENKGALQSLAGGRASGVTGCFTYATRACC